MSQTQVRLDVAVLPTREPVVLVLRERNIVNVIADSRLDHGQVVGLAAAMLDLDELQQLAIARPTAIDLAVAVLAEEVAQPAG